MKKLVFGLVLAVFGLLSCSSGGIVSASKKGHFAEAANITLEALVKRYQFIDAASIKWTAVTDANNNEFAEVSVRFDKNLDIIFNHFQEYINTGAMDVSVLMNQKHQFFDSLLNEKGFRVEDDSSSYTSLRFNMFEPDYGDPRAPVFFNCSGGTMILNLTVDKSKLVKIENATLVFDMQSPMTYSKDVKTYQLIYPLAIENVESALVNNTDIATE
jgi:hypothetical protein